MYSSSKYEILKLLLLDDFIDQEKLLTDSSEYDAAIKNWNFDNIALHAKERLGRQTTEIKFLLRDPTGEHVLENLSHMHGTGTLNELNSKDMSRLTLLLDIQKTSLSTLTIDQISKHASNKYNLFSDIKRLLHKSLDVDKGRANTTYSQRNEVFNGVLNSVISQLEASGVSDEQFITYYDHLTNVQDDHSSDEGLLGSTAKWITGQSSNRSNIFTKGLPVMSKEKLNIIRGIVEKACEDIKVIDDKKEFLKQSLSTFQSTFYSF